MIDGISMRIHSDPLPPPPPHLPPSLAILALALACPNQYSGIFIVLSGVVAVYILSIVISGLSDEQFMEVRTILSANA